MANEITAAATLRASKNLASVDKSFSKTLDMSGTDMTQHTQNIATSATQITLGNITGAPKKLLLVNLDSTNYVEVDSADTFDKFPQKLVAGDIVLLSSQTGTIYAKANTATVEVQIVAIEA